VGHKNEVDLPSESFAVVDQMIGEILLKAKAIKPEQIDAILVHQAQTGSRFGESAVLLGMASSEDVLYALAQQFHYPYSPISKQSLNGDLITAAQPFSKQSETFRAIRGQLLSKAFNKDDHKKALAVISANKGDGKSFFAANLSVVLSQLDGQTLLIDGDMRGPKLHEVFGVPNNAGLSGILSGRTAGEAICSIPDLPRLFLLPGGPIPPNPIELIERPAFSILLSELVNKFDYVIIDTPAAVHGSDATAISSKCGACLCVARQGNSRLSDIQNLMATMSSDSVKLAGVVLNEY
jgi:protein-tyrosine kinase